MNIDKKLNTSEFTEAEIKHLEGTVTHLEKTLLQTYGLTQVEGAYIRSNLYDHNFINFFVELTIGVKNKENEWSIQEELIINREPRKRGV